MIFFFSRHKRFFSWKKKKKRKIHLAKNEKKKISFNYFFHWKKKVSWKKRVHWTHTFFLFQDFFLHYVWHMENNVFIYHLYSMFLWKQFFPPTSHMKKIMISFVSLFHGKKKITWPETWTKIMIFFPYTVTVHLFFEKSKKKNCDKTSELFFYSEFFFIVHTWKKISHEKKITCLFCWKLIYVLVKTFFFHSVQHINFFFLFHCFC